MKTCITLGLMVSVVLAGTVFGDLLLNPGFSIEGSGGEQDAANWEQTDAGREHWGSHDGDGDLMALYGYSASTSGRFYQDVAGIGGATYTLDFWQEGDAAWNGTVLSVSLKWMDNSGASLGSSDMDLMPYSTLSTWTNIVLEATAPLNTATVRVEFASTTLSSGGGGAGKFDELVLTEAVPEPGTLICMILGLLGIIGWRRYRWR